MVDSQLAKVTGEPLRVFLGNHKKRLLQRRRVLNVARFVGGKTARRIFSAHTFDQQPYLDFCEQFQDGDKFVFRDLLFPTPTESRDRWLILYEFIDLLGPYVFEGDDLSDFYTEGPYEHGAVTLKRGDTVIDCGANMGMFSALASVKGCSVFAFEPVKYTIDNYLTKTTTMNRGITICPFALSDVEGELRFSVNHDNIGSSREADAGSSVGYTEVVQATTLDKFVHSYKIPKVDFIKADIEGAERAMLLGAREVIKTFSPKLSLCTYHLPDDPEVIRDIILSIDSRYKITQGPLKLYATIS